MTMTDSQINVQGGRNGRWRTVACIRLINSSGARHATSAQHVCHNLTTLGEPEQRNLRVWALLGIVLDTLCHSSNPLAFGGLVVGK